MDEKGWLAGNALISNSMRKSFYHLAPVWFVCILLPLPDLFFWWHPEDGRGVPLGLFFIGCASLVAYAFRSDIIPSANHEGEPPGLLWRNRMTTIGTALLLASIVFSLLWLCLIDARDFVAVFLACSILIPSLCIVPCLTLLTRNPIAAVVFTLFAVFAAKLLGCLIVVLVYGWHADAHAPPYTDMSWEHPNLLVWLFLLNTAILSVWFYILGRRKFRAIHEHAAPRARE